MRQANGTGSITKLTGNRRKPYMVRVPAKFDLKEGAEKETVIRPVLGYYATKKEATAALQKFNANPYDVDGNSLTFAELYTEWSEQHFKGIGAGRKRTITAAYKRAAVLHDRRFSSLRVKDFQKCIDDSGGTYAVVNQLKQLCSALSEYALKNDYITKNYATYADLSAYRNYNPNGRKPVVFSDSEIETLKNHSGKDKEARMILMLIYTGVRIDEMLSLRANDVDLQEKTISIRKSKTDAGVRVIPIADKIFPFFAEVMKDAAANNTDVLFRSRNETQIAYDTYKKSHFLPYTKQLGMTHRIHDTRHTCTSLLYDAEVPLFVIDMIVGHRNQKSVTLSTYTHVPMDRLREAINRI